MAQPNQPPGITPPPYVDPNARKKTDTLAHLETKKAAIEANGGQGTAYYSEIKNEIDGLNNVTTQETEPDPVAGS